MKTLFSIALTACLTCWSGLAHTAVFAPDAEDLAAMSPQEQAKARETMRIILAGIPPEQKAIRIGGMEFDLCGRTPTSAFMCGRWVEGRVWVDFDSNVSTQNRQRFWDAAWEWEAIADLSFRRRTDQGTYVYVKSSDRNWSRCGIDGGGKRSLEIVNWNRKGTIMHEIGHALGLMHEHSRTNRDNYINIHWTNIEIGKKHNFYELWSTRYGGYDFDSIMHYAKRDFARHASSGNTISMKSGYEDWLDKIGQRNYLSERDKRGMAQRYGSVPTQIAEPKDEGIRWVHGETQRIRWRGFTDWASRVELIAGGEVVHEIADEVRFSSLDWVIPDPIPPGDNYRIRVTSCSTPSTTAESEHPFTIAAQPRLIYPSDAGIQWTLGQPYFIQWENIPGDEVEIFLYGQGGHILFTTLTPNTGIYEYRVNLPAHQATGRFEYGIEVASVSASHFALSPNPFAIGIYPLVTSPVAGAGPWLVGQTYPIRWAGFPPEDAQVRIVLESARFSGETIIAPATENNGLFNWSIPSNFFFADYHVRVESLLDSGRFGRSSVIVQIKGAEEILDPKGSGVNWYLGGRHTIRWSGFVGPTVRIDLCKNDRFLFTIAESAANTGHHQWRIPDIYVSTGDFFSIQIASRTNNSQHQISTCFTISNPPAIVVVPSDPGEVWTIGSARDIEWIGFPGDTVAIYLYRGEADFDPDSLRGRASAADETIWTLSAKAPNTGSFSWAPTKSIPEDTEYRIRIVSNTDGTIFDDSDHAFSILPADHASPIVTYPTASDVEWTRGATHPIHWRNFTGSFTVQIDLLKDGAVFMPIIASTPNSGTYYWTVPVGVRIGPGHKVRVQGSGTGMTAVSVHPFTINGTQRVKSPSDPEFRWYRGDTMTIEWENFMNHQEVRIDLCRRGELVRPIALYTFNDGHYEWPIPEDLPIQPFGSTFQIRVTSIGNEHESAFSLPVWIGARRDAMFSDAGWGVKSGGTYTIQWGGIAGSTVRIDLFQDGLFLRTLIASAPNTGVFQWMLDPKEIWLGSDYQLRITSLSDELETVFLDPAFDITPGPEVLAPRENAGWRIGRKYTIEWKHFGGTTVHIQLIHGGLTAPYLIAQGAPNQGAYDWTVPGHLNPGAGYQARVIGAGNIVETATSSAFEILPPSRVLQPAKDTLWTPNTEPVIEWEGFSGELVVIYLTRPNMDPITITETPDTEETINDGSYQAWTILPDMEEATDYRVQVVSVSDPVESAFSEPFKIESLPPTVFSPQPLDEIWFSGAEYAVEWTGFSTTMVQVELFRGSMPYRTMSSGTVNNGLFMWTVPVDVEFGNDFKVKVTSLDLESEYAFSGGAFTIAERPFEEEPTPTPTATPDPTPTGIHSSVWLVHGNNAPITTTPAPTPLTSPDAWPGAQPE